MYGLSEEEIDILKKSFASFPQLEKAVLYGSRAMGNYKRGSDIDLVLYGDDLKDALFYIYDDLDEQLPYFIDITSYDTITNEKLKQHISKVGKVIYNREKDNTITA